MVATRGLSAAVCDLAGTAVQERQHLGEVQTASPEYDIGTENWPMDTRRAGGVSERASPSPEAARDNTRDNTSERSARGKKKPAAAVTGAPAAHLDLASRIAVSRPAAIRSIRVEHAAAKMPTASLTSASAPPPSWLEPQLVVEVSGGDVAMSGIDAAGLGRSHSRRGKKTPATSACCSGMPAPDLQHETVAEHKGFGMLDRSLAEPAVFDEAPRQQTHGSSSATTIAVAKQDDVGGRPWAIQVADSSTTGVRGESSGGEVGPAGEAKSSPVHTTGGATWADAASPARQVIPKAQSHLSHRRRRNRYLGKPLKPAAAGNRCAH